MLEASTRMAGGRYRLDKLPWDMSPATMQRFAPGVYDPDKDIWELYNLKEDFSQAHNLAEKEPKSSKSWSIRGGKRLA